MTRAAFYVLETQSFDSGRTLYAIWTVSRYYEVRWNKHGTILMDPHEIAELEKVLQRHQGFLYDQLQKEDLIETDYYFQIAGWLRVLLCDKDIPILLKYADVRQVELYVWGPRKLPPSLQQELIFHMRSQIASWVPFQPHSHKYTIEEFLDTPIGYESIQVAGASEPRPYTPRQLIKWVANKDGVSHLDFKKPQIFRKVKAWQWNSKEEAYEDGLVRKHIVKLGEWAYHAIRDLLAPQEDASIVIRFTLREMPSEEVPFFVLESPYTGTQLLCVARSDTICFKIRHSSVTVAEINANYPDSWQIGTDCIFVLVYDSSERKVSTLVNNERADQIAEINLGGIVSDQPTAPTTPGYGKYFSGNIALFERIITPEDVDEILSLPTNWIEAVKEKGNST